MNNAQWFSKQLEASTESLLWGMEQIPAARLNTPPPAKLGEWTALRQAYHVLHYEREVALPSIRHWLGEPYPTFDGYNEQAAWESGHDWAEIKLELQAVRAAIIDTLYAAPDAAWDEARNTAWGHKTLYWVASKTYQHGIEHLSNILRAAMLWDHYASRQPGPEDPESRPISR